MAKHGHRGWETLPKPERYRKKESPAKGCALRVAYKILGFTSDLPLKHLKRPLAGDLQPAKRTVEHISTQHHRTTTGTTTKKTFTF